MHSLNLRAGRLGFSTTQVSGTDELQIEEPEKTNEPSVSSPDLSASFPSNLSKLPLPQAMPILRMAGIIVIMLMLVWIGSWVVPEILSPTPTAGASTTALSSAPASQPASAMATHPPFVSSTPPASLLTASPLPGSTLRHKVVEGESLMLIARCYGANFGEVRNANPEIGDPQGIVPGMIVKIPNLGSVGRIYGPPCVKQYTVQSGDTWVSIAQRNNADVAVLQNMNPDRLSVGQVLIVPLNSAGGGVVLLPPPPTPLPTPAGATSVSHQEGELGPSAVTSYQFQGNKGQLMRLKVESDGSSLVIVVYLVEGERLELAGSSLEWSTHLPQSGKYIIEISNASNNLTISYTLDVSLTTDATPTS